MSSPPKLDRLPYRLRNKFLSSTEMSLFLVLQEMSDGRYVICPKVALNDIFYIQRPNENIHFYNKIFRKHVDFLLCQPDDMTPAIGVDLVRPLSKDDTRSADQYIENLFLSAGLPLVHVPSSETYELTDIVELFHLALLKLNETESLREDDTSDSAPLCPKCGLMMALRIYREGSKAGKRYYGCINSPTCDGIVPID